MFEDLMSPETEEERRRRLEQTLGMGLGIFDEQPAPTPTYQPPLNSMMPNALAPFSTPETYRPPLNSMMPGSSVPLPSPNIYQPPLNSMKPNAIVPLPDSPMPGPYSTDMWQPPMNSMKPSAVVPLPSFDIADVATERQPLWANVMGPAAPGQRESDWKNYGNGVMINDGVTPGAAMSPQPGAGYTANGISIPHPGDMDWGNRVAQEPYTNPLVQATIRDHQMKMELQKQALDSHMAIAQSANNVKGEHVRYQDRMRGLSIAGNTKLPAETRKATVDELDIPENEKLPLKIETDLSVSDNKGNPQSIGVGKDGSFQEIMTRAGSYEPTILRKFLESQRGVSPAVAVQRLNTLRNKSMNTFLNPFDPLTKQEKNEMTFIQRLYGDKMQMQKPAWFQGEWGPQYEEISR